MGPGNAVELAPITPADIQEVGKFLNAHLDPRVSARTWADSAVPPWSVDAPNHGFMLRDDGRIVGAYLAFYSRRMIRGQEEAFCNLGAWCVLDTHRAHGLRLLRALLAQPGYHFTDLSPSKTVQAVNSRLKFRRLDSATVLVPNVRWPRPARGARIVTDPASIVDLLDPATLRIYRDHLGAAAARQFVVDAGTERCLVVARRERRKGVRAFATILHVSDRSVFRQHESEVYRHLLVRHGALATLVEPRVVGHRPSHSKMLAPPRPKMFRSATLDACDIDDLYSELACVNW